MPIKLPLLRSGFKNITPAKVVSLLAILVIGIFSYLEFKKSRTHQTQYQTEKAEKGTLITSVSASGTITSGNSTSVTTKVSGTVRKVYVTNGDKVTKGQKVADVTIDEYAAQREAAAWVVYLDAQEAVKVAEKSKIDADIQRWEDRQAVLDAEEEVNYKNTNVVDRNDDVWTESGKVIVDKTLEQAKKTLELSELKYNNSDSDIQAAYAKVASTYRDYQENSSIIYATTEGVISDLTLAPKIVINASSATSSSTGATIISSQTVGKITSTSGQLTATVNLAEIDVINVKANQKVTLTLDAYPDKTFTGKVLAVNTAGNVSSGVTSYPVSILLDPVSTEIYPNMAVNIEIITRITNDVILVPSTAIKTENDQSVILVKKDNLITTVQVEIGGANDSQTEVISGINEGDEVVTQVITPEDDGQPSDDTTSPFSGIRRSNESRGGPPGGF